MASEGNNASEGDECYLPTHMLEVSIVEDNNATATELQDVFLDVNDADEPTAVEEVNEVSTRFLKKRDGIPVIPTSSEELEYYKILFEDLSLVRYLRIHCTICDCHIGCRPESSDIAFRHRVLGVLVCKQCYVFYGEGDFPKGDDGSEVYCRWCGQGGRLVCCSSCPCTFCKKCISRNFTKKTKLEFDISIDWECFICNPRSLWEHRALCWAVTNYIQKENEDWMCGIESGGQMYGPKIPGPGDDPSFCCEGTASHRRITMGMPEEERMTMFVHSARRQKNLEASLERTLLAHLETEKNNTANKLPRIKPRDISELTGEKPINTASLLQPPLVNPISVMNTSNVSDIKYVCTQLPPMVQIPTNSLPTVRPPNGNLRTSSPVLTSATQFGGYIFKAVSTANNNVMTFPVVTSNQLVNSKMNYFPNPMAAVLRCSTSQPTTLGSKLFTTLTQGTNLVSSSAQGNIPRPFTKIAIVNGQLVPNTPGSILINPGQKRFVTPVVRPVGHFPNVNQTMCNIPPLNNFKSYAAPTNLPSSTINIDDEDDDVRIISSTTHVKESDGSNTLKLPKADHPPSQNVNASECEVNKTCPSISNQSQVASPRIISFCRQLKNSFEDVDEISRGMANQVLQMKKLYKKLKKEKDLTGIEALGKNFQKLMKVDIKKLSQIDANLLNELESYKNEDSSNTVQCINSDDISPIQESDSFGAGKKAVYMDWDSSDSDDNITENSKITLAKADHLVAKKNEVRDVLSAKDKIISTNIQFKHNSGYRDSNCGRNLNRLVSDSPTECGKSLTCTAPMKRKHLDVENGAPFIKRKCMDTLYSVSLKNTKEDSRTVIHLYREIESNQNNLIPAKWAKLIRPCSVVFVKKKYLLDNQEIDIAV